MVYEAELRWALSLADTAAKAVMTIYESGQDLGAEEKADGSLVTRADKAAERIILERLEADHPEDAVLSEESLFEPQITPPRRLWVIDPVDGTLNFYNRTGDFGVMIGLLVEGAPVLGVIVAPALERAWYGGVGLGVFERRGGQVQRLGVSPAGDPLRVLISRGSSEVLTDTLTLLKAQAISRGSVGVKVGLVLSGEADAYLYPGGLTSLWDACAPQALMEALGGRLTTHDGASICYDPSEPENPRGILAASSGIHEQISLAVRRVTAR